MRETHVTFKAGSPTGAGEFGNEEDQATATQAAAAAAAAEVAADTPILPSCPSFV